MCPLSKTQKSNKSTSNIQGEGCGGKFRMLRTWAKFAANLQNTIMEIASMLVSRRQPEMGRSKKPEDERHKFFNTAQWAKNPL
jgi:hypothetical protein